MPEFSGCPMRFPRESLESRTGRLILLSFFLGALLLCGGCQWVAQALGYEGAYMLVGEDVLAVPGQQVCIEARLRKVSTFAGPSPRAVYIFQGANIFHVAQTDANGTVCALFRPPAPGDYRFIAKYYRGDDPNGKPVETEVLVACREPNTPLCVVDIDNTLSEARGREVLFGEPNAMSGSVPVMARLANRYTVVYLTHRWDYLAKKTREWLRRQGYPEGPIFAARGSGQVLEDNEKFKAGVLAGIRGQFRGPGYGIGDQASDVLAYTRAGLQGVLFIEMCDLAKPSAVRDALEQLQAVPDTAQVVCAWSEFEKIVFEGASFSPGAARQRLEARLKELERGK